VGTRASYLDGHEMGRGLVEGDLAKAPTTEGPDVLVLVDPLLPRLGALHLVEDEGPHARHPSLELGWVGLGWIGLRWGIGGPADGVGGGWVGGETRRRRRRPLAE